MRRIDWELNSAHNFVGRNNRRDERKEWAVMERVWNCEQSSASHGKNLRLTNLIKRGMIVHESTLQRVAVRK